MSYSCNYLYERKTRVRKHIALRESCKGSLLGLNQSWFKMKKVGGDASHCIFLKLDKINKEKIS